MILIMDNYDSFVYNIAQYVGELGRDTKVIRNDAIDMDGVRALAPSGIIISPGPGRPTAARDIGICIDIIGEFASQTPIMGICLGHQAIVHTFGGKIIRADRIMHGKTSMIEHDEKDLFKDVKNPLEVMRYHSLVPEPESFPSEHLNITARTVGNDEIFGVRHKDHQIYGIQFHPESIGTEHGLKIIKNFLEVCGD